MPRSRRRWALPLAVLFVGALLAPVGVAGRAGAAAAPACDPIDGGQCLMPFPDNYFTVADSTTDTGRRLHYASASMPVNGSGTPVDPTDINRSDGFSPGSEIIVEVPGIDLARTGIAPITDIGKSLAPNAPVVLLDTRTHQRVPYWAELDTWNNDQPTRALVIRPARNFLEGHRIAVGLRNMKNASGVTLHAPIGFTAIRDNLVTGISTLEARRASVNAVINNLGSAGVKRNSLYLAWDFTVASERGLAGGMLQMRDDAYARLGNRVPVVNVTSVDENVSGDVLRRVQGTFDVPLYLTENGAPGSRLVLGRNGLPVRTGTYHAEFRCIIPRSVVDLAGHVKPARGIVYGHGLLGDTGEIEGLGPFANKAGMVVCATPWIGMASDDVGNVFNVISDFSKFGSIPDRLQQSLLNFQFLARLIKDPRGFGRLTAFRAGAPAGSVFKPDEVYFNGNSQGGILGGAATAISKEWTQAVLGVPAINYSELLPRSVDFDVFLTLLNATYPDQHVHTLLLALAQITWDRGDSDGYAQHITTNNYKNTPQHRVLLIEAFGDHQVANIGTETEARTIGAKMRKPALAAGRSNDVVPFWGIDPVPRSPYRGSVLEMWDFGTPAPPTESRPPESPQYGSDPHGAARNVPTVQDQVSRYLTVGGRFFDECGRGPCQG